MEIVNLFYELARQHKQIRGFAYGKDYDKGAGNGTYPLVWLDDPVYGQSSGNRTLRYIANVDVLDVPSDARNILDVQSAAFYAGLSFIEQIKGTQANTGFTVDGFTFLSLRDYYDDNAAGVRFTYTIVQVNPVDRCADIFDSGRTFEMPNVLPDFGIDHPDGCAIFNDKTGLPNFKITI